jgi:hypothetical protein
MSSYTYFSHSIIWWGPLFNVGPVGGDLTVSIETFEPSQTGPYAADCGGVVGDTVIADAPNSHIYVGVAYFEAGYTYDDPVTYVTKYLDKPNVIQSEPFTSYVPANSVISVDTLFFSGDPVGELTFQFTPVPVPDGLPLFAIGLICLFLFTRISRHGVASPSGAGQGAAG